MKSRTFHLAAAALLVAVAAAPLSAQQQQGKSTHVSERALKWGSAPAVFPSGAKMAVVSGDPSKPAPFVVRLEFRDGYTIAPHYHPTDEVVTVRQGSLLVGMGDSVDVAMAEHFKPGQRGSIKAGMHHWARARGHTQIEVSAMGPFQLTYVHPSDDPQKGAKR